MTARAAAWFACFAIACSSTPAAKDGGPDTFADAAPPPDDGPVTPVACGPLDLEPYRAASCFCGAACDCFLDIPYGDAIWTEGGETLAQAIDLFVPSTPVTDAPLVLWAHPNGSTKEIGAGTPLAEDVAVPLLDAGTLFASVEFRHPSVNADIGAPRTDIASAVQFLRCHAASIGLDSERVAAIGRSRGTLAIWTAVQDDLAVADGDPERTHSTRLRGVYALNAQTSYWGQWIANAFFEESSRAVVVARLGEENHGHAVGDVSADDPAIELVYDAPLPALPLEATDCSALGGAVDCLHLPAFGDALCTAYAVAGARDRCQVTYGVAEADVLTGAVPFLNAVLAP